MMHFTLATARPLGWIVPAVMACAVWAGSARADLTVEKLTGRAIAGIGPFFQDVDDAIREFGAKDYVKAFAHLQSAKKSTPRLPPAEIMMAELHFDAGQAGPGIVMLETAVRQSPQDPEAFIILAERALGEGRLTEAGLLFDKSSQVLNRFAENARRKQNLQVRLYSGSATVDETMGNVKEALRSLEELSKVDPNNGAARARLGRALFRSGDQKKAYAEFQAAAEADKTLQPAELAMASLSTDRVKSEQWLNVALKKTPVDLRTRLGAAEFLMRNNQIEEAKVQAQEALKLDPHGLETNLSMGIMDRLQGDFKSAVAYLSTAHLLAPANPVIINHLALSLLELPDEESHRRSLEFAELNLRQNPNVPEVMAAFGWINHRLKRPLEAQRAFMAVLATAGTHSANQTMSADIGYYLAEMAKEKGQTAESLRILKETLSSNQPFAYRKPAQALLAELTKAEKTSAAKGKEKPAPKTADSASKGDKTAK
ncbi:MAG TPA: tetratricopeptide repeat protein [Pirellulales bacterium]|jgi:tetratricopeptide (TPR) repeat protein|nr:tetratricopeptide repeat protein [Pirellulales bacterium]